MHNEKKKEKIISKHRAQKEARKELGFNPELTGISGNKLRFFSRKVSQKRVAER